MVTGWQSIWVAFYQSYLDFAEAMPLVIAGLILLGAIYFRFALPAGQRGKGWRGLMAYLAPAELYRSNSARIDIWIWIINGLIFIPAFQVVVALCGLIGGSWLDQALLAAFGPRTGLVGPLWVVVTIQVLASYFGQGFGQYSSHLALHKIPALWAIHRAHHSAEAANIFAFLRSHPLEIFINSGFRIFCGALALGLAIYATGGKLLPETIAALVWYNLIYVIIGGFRSVDHTHIPIRFGGPFDILIGSPIMHQVHHSAEPQHRDVNMGGSAYVYDWIFGTAYVPRRHETWRWGLNEAEMGNRNPHPTLNAFFLEPMRSLWNHLKRPGVRQ